MFVSMKFRRLQFVNEFEFSTNFFAKNHPLVNAPASFSRVVEGFRVLHRFANDRFANQLDMFRDNRSRPNILISGTPGTGKTTLSALVATRLGMRHICVGDLVKEQNLHDGRMEEFDTHILNEDKLCDYLEDIMTQGGVVIDFHTVDFFPERWFDLVVVLRCDNDLLFPRLEARCETLFFSLLLVDLSGLNCMSSPLTFTAATSQTRLRRMCKQRSCRSCWTRRWNRTTRTL
jgi:hypothetical protein